VRPNETVIALGQERLEPLGRTVIRAKLLNERTLRIREVTWDPHFAIPVDYEELHAEARDAWHATHGAAHPDVVAALEGAEAAAMEVAVEPETEDDRDAIAAEIGALGGVILEVQPSAIVVLADPDVVRGIARIPHVANVLPYEAPELLSLTITKELAESSLTATHAMGSGSTMPVAIWEPMACVQHTHPDFVNVTWPPYAQTGCAPDALVTPVIGHSTMIAGIIAAKRSTGTAGLFRGTLFEVPLSAGSPAEATMWQQAKLVNASFTIDALSGAKIDEEVYKRGTFVFNGAGNDTPSQTRCYAYNALCVGGYNGNYQDWKVFGYYPNDVPYGGSTTNRFNREGPHVLGPAFIHKTAKYSSKYTAPGEASGTSFATAAITRLAGLLLANHEMDMPVTLARRPALMRAVLMASAQAHPVRENGLAIPYFKDGIDDRMGVGAPNGERAQKILASSAFRYVKASPSYLQMTQASFAVGSGERVRVVLAWDQCPGYEKFDPRLKVDLDLVVRTPYLSSTLTYTNASLYDNWEVVEFVTTKSGTATVNVSAPTFGTCTAEGGKQLVPMAIAWTKEPAYAVQLP